jgi:AcrR family transcriptional regulator
MIELPDLVPELLGWAGSYRHPITIKTANLKKRTTRTAATPASRTTQRLSKGRHNLPRSFVIHNQRERIIDAVATITAQKSYEELTVPDIASVAGLSHHTFYEHFANKNHAFLAAFETGSQQALNLTAQAHAAKADWPDAVHAAIHTLIEYLVSEPAFARLGSVGILAAGPQALAQRDQILQGFSLLLAPGNRYSSDSADIPAITAEALTGGLLEILYYYISNDRINDLPTLVPELTYIALTPFLGTKEAAKASNKPLTS